MPERVIQARLQDSALQLRDCLRSLLALELCYPSQKLYLVAPVLNDTPLLVNEAGQLAPLLADVGQRTLSLAHTLNLLAERGGQVHVIYAQQHPQNTAFVQKLDASMVSVRADESTYHNGLFGDHFTLTGMMHFAPETVSIAGDHITLNTEPDAVRRALFEVREYWKDLAT